jgi:hypothetical protein
LTQITDGVIVGVTRILYQKAKGLYMLVMHTVEKKPALDVQVRHAMESFEDKAGEVPSTLYCHPDEAGLYADVTLTIKPVLPSKNTYWIGNE